MQQVQSIIDQEMQIRYDLTKRLAREAGALALEKLQELKSGAIEIESKGISDFVTKADREVECFIRDTIAAEFPDDGLLGEEYAATDSQNSIVWVIDPIDGTANFIRDLDNWGVSIACVRDGCCEIGAIYDPNKDFLFHAVKGGGAFKETTPLHHGHKTNTPPNPVMALGHSRRLPLSLYLNTIQYLFDERIEHRRAGSAAIALSQAAEGKVDGYFEGNLNAWDCMAGLLINKEAGNIIQCGDDIQRNLSNGAVLVGNPYLLPQLEALERICRSELAQ
ncbi:inositol monophosphatase [uncultured Cohaesibacter sp.]|uniref:inositol monophosphatase family protein n=1 Tax=uncultured Cohaesibacter sp. TaxID=1002546 RepID=UPI00293088D1|nr:inositol monophosphatase [uncultured Cohaesibacter sp.]